MNDSDTMTAEVDAAPLSLTEPSAHTAAEEPLFSNKDLRKLFIPLVVEQFLEYLVTLVNSILVSNVGEPSVSGLSLVDSVMQLFINMFLAVATGGAIIIGQYLGRKQQDNAKEAANQLIWFSGGVSIIATGIIYLIKPFIFRVVFGQITEEVYGHANTYFMIIVVSLPFLAIYQACSAILRTSGNSKLPMKVMLIMNILNLGASALLIFTTNTGTAGVAICLLVTRILMAVILVCLLMKEKNPIRIKPTIRHKFNWPMIKRIMRIGLPYALEYGTFYLGRILVISLVSSLGTPSIMANSVGNNIGVFTNIPGIGINLGLTTVISRCIGKGDYKQAQYYHKKVIKIIYIANAVASVVVAAAMPLLFKPFTMSEEARSMAATIIWTFAGATIFFWPPGNSTSVTFRAAGDARFPMVVSTVSMFLCRVVAANLLNSLFGLGVLGTFIAMYLDWIVKGIFFTLHYKKGKWMQYRSI